MSVKDSLDAFGKRIVQQSRSNLSKSKKKDTGELYKSLKYDLTVSKNSISLSFKMEAYGKFVDKGVKGKSSSALAPNSPYKFGSGGGVEGGLTEGIKGWTKRKRLQFKDRKTGRFYSYEQTAFMITRSVYQKGLQTTNFFEKPFRNEFKKLPDELVKKYALEVNSMLQNAFKS